MGRWSAALFGHHKHRYELREKEATLKRMPMGKNYQGIMQYRDELVNEVVGRFLEMPTGFNEDKLFVYAVTGWEKRAVPGDVAAIEPLGHKWTPHERRRFLIVTVDGLGLDQISGLIEPVFDMDSYPEYNPLTFTEFDGHLVLGASNAKNNELALRKYGQMDRQAAYAKFIDRHKEACAFPQGALKKRRFHMELLYLVNVGVDISKMLDTEQLYSPELPDIHMASCFDKLKQRHILASDNLRVIQPRVFD